MKLIEGIVKVIPTVCATGIALYALNQGLNHDLMLYVVLGILGIDLISLRAGAKSGQEEE